MTERLVIAATLLAAIAVAGIYARQAAAAWSANRSASTRLPGVDTGAPRLLVFSTRFCGDCATQLREIEASRATWSRPVDISYHDAVAENDVARRFGILTVPAIVVARSDGQVVGVRQGLVRADRLRSLIENAA